MFLSHTVTPDETSQTLYQLLRGPLALSGRQAREAKQSGRVSVDDAPFFSNQHPRAGQVIRVELGEYAPAAPPPAVHAVRVLFEDDALIAVYKPALLQCHPSSSAPHGSDTLQSRVCSQIGACVHPVHRLDAETSGIVLFAKLPYAQSHLQRQMQSGMFRKRYHAWVWGRPDPPDGWIDAPIARKTPDSFTRIVREGGQRAVSAYSVLKTLVLKPEDVPVSLVELSPVTGRTHQLRVHMAYIGCPILGDTRYHTRESTLLSTRLCLQGQQLAAVQLCFLHPLTGEPVTIQCPAEFAFSPPADDLR